MVQFERQLETHVKASWADYYVDYASLKTLLATEAARTSRGSSASSAPPRVAHAHSPNLTVKSLLTEDDDEEDDEGPDDGGRRRTEGAPGLPASSSSASEVDLLTYAGFTTPKTLGTKTAGTRPAPTASTPLLTEASSLDSGDLLQDEDIHRRFLRALESELRKVNDFYMVKLRDCQARLELQRDLLQLHYVATDEGAWIEEDYVMAREHSAAAEAFAEIGRQADHGSAKGETRQARSLQHAMRQLHRRCYSLAGFRSLNYAATVQILKMHDGLFPDVQLRDRALPWVAALGFRSDQRLGTIQSEVEYKFAQAFLDGDTEASRSMLALERGQVTTMDMFNLGWRTGVACGLVAWLFWDVVIDGRVSSHARGHTFVKDPAWHLYKACGGLILLGYAWGAAVFVFRLVGINWVDILNVDRRLSMSHVQIFDEASLCSLVYGADFLLYLKVVRRDTGFMDGVPNCVLPGLLVLFLLSRLAFPWNQRRALFSTLGEVIVAPFAPVTFRHTFVADVVTSLVRVWTDFALAACFYSSGDFLLAGSQQLGPDSPSCRSGSSVKAIVLPILSVLPLWFRCMQCLRVYRDSGDRWPHLANAFKYALAQSVSLFGVFHPSWSHGGGRMNVFRGIWIAMFLAATLYQFFWDVRMDWGLAQFVDRWQAPASDQNETGSPNAGGHARRMPTRERSLLLRERLMYATGRQQQWTYMYYLAMIVDLVLRMTWTISLIPTNEDPFGIGLQEYLNPIFAVLEIGRRTMWALFRLEHEHLKLAMNKDSAAGLDTVVVVLDAHTEASLPDDYDEQRRRKSFVESLLFGGCVVAIAVAAGMSKET